MRIEAVDYHAGGEPFRIVTGGVEKTVSDTTLAGVRAPAPADVLPADVAVARFREPTRRLHVQHLSRSWRTFDLTESGV